MALYGGWRVTQGREAIQVHYNDRLIMEVTEDGVTIQDAADVALKIASTTRIEIDATGIGFFTATPVGQQNVPLTTPSTQDVIDALVALGLVEQSDP